jgi:hypothetical protein
MTDTRLHDDTIRILRDRREDIADNIELCEDDDDIESAREWMGIWESMDRVLATPTIATLAAEKQAADEIENELDRGDEYRTASGSPNAKHRRVTADLCRAGHNEQYDADAYYSSRPSTMIVDGIRYVVGR